ncbi:GNAT family N-acetyltransferase [Pelagicoccus sp. NFK12]|uniref:GNAT family N-acetyltransferase n=1 Tax=Pelagicoccus enzymogenes TaxID=2773457 RepID=A0A927FA61_9BACT|nr:GNAT family N-acetyltransferase [Pelagicoccus enzymogenes]MBD5779975.1 GNAT family N-acetyltransferase [Pelagicoccus enzymogenes]
MKIEFPKAQPQQAKVLSDLAIESKGHWGYSKEQLDIWRKDLKIEEEEITQNLVRTILAEGELVGFFSIKREKNEDVLDHLWLLSKAIGRGIGNQAFKKIKEDCMNLKIEEFTVISDPDAEGFYLKQGCVRVGEVESKPQNRMLPKLKYRIKEIIQNQSCHTTPASAPR